MRISSPPWWIGGLDSTGPQTKPQTQVPYPKKTSTTHLLVGDVVSSIKKHQHLGLLANRLDCNGRLWLLHLGLHRLLLLLHLPGTYATIFLLSCRQEQDRKMQQPMMLGSVLFLVWICQKNIPLHSNIWKKFAVNRTKHDVNMILLHSANAHTMMCSVMWVGDLGLLSAAPGNRVQASIKRCLQSV